MKVLFINSVVDYGSTGKIVRDLANGLKNMNHEVSIIYGRFSAKNDIDTLKIDNKVSFYLHYIKSRLLGKNGQYSKKETKRMIAHIESFKPDVIHLHNIHGYYLNVPILFDYLEKSKIPVIWTLHDCWAFSGSAAYFDFYGCKEWEEGCVLCNNTKEYPINQFGLNQRETFLMKKNAFTSLEHLQIVTVSNWLRDLTQTTFLKKYPIRTIYNGINEHVFKPTVKQTGNKKMILGVANDWEERKGLQDFIKLRSILDMSIEIVLIGLNEKQIQSLPSGIVGITRTDSQESLVQYYSEANVYVNLSVEETMGLTTLEALACGTPVVVYNKTAVPELVNEDVGIVADTCSIENLALQIKDVIDAGEDKYPKDVLRSHALKYTNDIMIQNYLELYDKYRQI